MAWIKTENLSSGGGGGGLTPDQLKRLSRIGVPLRIDGDTSILSSGHLGYTNTGIIIDAFPDDGGAVDITVTMPDTTGTEFAAEIDNQSATDLNVIIKDFGGSTLETVPPTNAFAVFFDSLQSPAVTAWELMHKQGNPVPQLDPVKYSDFNGIAFSNLLVSCFTVSYLGSQMVNHPFSDIIAGSTYTVQFDQINKTGTFSQLVRIVSTDSDFTNPDLNRLITRGAVDLGSAAAVGWRKHAFQSDEKASFFSSNLNTDPIVINDDSVAPSFLGPIEMNSSSGISLVDAATGTMRNDTGRTISMTGTINYNPDKGGGGTTTLNLVSERSNDGVTWFGNLESRRSMEVSNNSESFGTKLSLIIDWLPNQQLRFRAWRVDGTLSFVSSTVAAIGENYVTPSLVWELSEL